MWWICHWKLDGLLPLALYKVWTPCFKKQTGEVLSQQELSASQSQSRKHSYQVWQVWPLTFVISTEREFLFRHSVFCTMKEKMVNLACANQITNIGTTIFIAPEIQVTENGDEQPGRFYPMKKAWASHFFECNKLRLRSPQHKANFWVNRCKYVTQIARKLVLKLFSQNWTWILVW